MRIEFNEYDNSVDFMLFPESAEDFAQLARFTKNAKSQKPYVVLSFSNKPYCHISLAKIKPSVQYNSIHPTTGKQ